MTTIVKYSAANGVNDEALFQRLLASPRLSLLVNRLEKQLADETKKRQEFYAMYSPLAQKRTTVASNSILITRQI